MSLPKYVLGLVLSLFLVSLTACGTDPDNSIYDEPLYPTDTLTDAQKGALKTQVGCEDSANCNPSVGMLISTHGGADQTGFGACTASLIGESLLATNSHCIPEDLKRRHSACKDRMWIFFPQAGMFAAERVDCAEVIEASDLSSADSPDFAFIKLAQAVKRPVLAVDPSGFADEKEFFLNKVDPYINRTEIFFTGLLRKVSCKSVMKTMVLPEYSNPHSPLVMLADCLVVHGNSGSSILDEKGNARGVIQALFKKDALSRELTRKGIPTTEADIADLNVGTSFSCVQTPAEKLQRTIPASCRANKPADIVKIDEGALEKELDELLSVAQWKDKDHFTWSLRTVEDSGYSGGSDSPLTRTRFAPVPFCFQDPASWLDSYRSGLFNRTRKSTTLRSLILPVFQFAVARDQYLRLRLKAETTYRYVISEIDFSPRDVEKKGQSMVLHRQSGVLPGPTTLDLLPAAQLGVCK